MASPYKHALNSQEKWGGSYKDYLPIHEFLDSTKLHMATWQHRAILHNTFGVGICEQIFGPFIKNNDGKEIETRYIAIKHIEEDCGSVPTIEQWLNDLKPKKFAINLKKGENYEEKLKVFDVHTKID
jgi:primase-polymerase (primpol)-like protein